MIRTLGGRMSAAPIFALAEAFRQKSIVISSHSAVFPLSRGSSVANPSASFPRLKAKTLDRIPRSACSKERRSRASTQSNPPCFNTSRAFSLSASFRITPFSAVSISALWRRFLERIIPRILSRSARFSFPVSLASFSLARSI